MAHGRGSRRNRRIAATAVAGIIVLAAATALALALRPDPVDPTIAFADITWSELTPSGSAILETRGKPPPPGKNLVGRRVYFGSNASEDEIKAFYSTLLDGRQGWVPDGSTSGLMTTAEIDACTWHSSDLTFRLGLRNMRGWRELRAADRGWPTVFSIEVLDGSSDKLATTACLTDR